MGSCISKCKPKKTSKKNQQKQEECNCQCIEKNITISSTPLVQDKLVISQLPISSPPTTKCTIISPSSPLTSSSSAKSSCTNSNYPTTSTSTSTSTSASSSSCSVLSSASSFASAASSMSSKFDQAFSNDYLWSCVKENPQILNSHYLPMIKVLNPRRNSLPIRCQNNGKKPNRYREFPGPSPQRVVVRSAAQKRPRCNSPSNLTRQKSFRGEPEVEPIRPISRSGRDLRPNSPSSSRRFNGEANNNQGRSLTSSMMRENSYVRPPSPNKSYYNNSNMRKYGGSNNLLVKRESENVMKGVSSKREELGVGGLVSSQDMDLMPIEDVENPHIALDCFIFL
ncbi:hypothetical protein BVRB_1g010430 [Beta vulgaris subsp. vulgaris]|uniref:uncharacterized serine-rich protein C215.13 n=1 Tax=Beta vulgaris subsp. vulgaris TaxID=3555 RepID=UPI00065C488F|nr:uncharacterized serine-rich protein C215.13 [Beta vulgaris subsp. vulgaris]KMT19656.1 hypothetical protein BVRB_1g010430 [Beta vulgaris subsp. vulgaris]